MAHHSPYQALAEVRSTTGAHLWLRPFDTVERVVISPERIAVLIHRHSVTERSTEDILTARSLYFLEWKLRDGTWEGSELFVPDPTFVQTRHKRFGWPTLAERTEKRRWEDLCARPGDKGRFGERDTVARIAQYSTVTTTEKRV